jgi:hypothetical protein
MRVIERQGQLAPHDCAIAPEPNTTSHIDRSFAPMVLLQS